MTYLVTGAMGYIGARVARDLLASGRMVVSFDRVTESAEAREVLGEDLERIVRVQGDIGDMAHVFRAVGENGVEVIVHNAFSMDTADYRPRALGVQAAATAHMVAELDVGVALRVNAGGMYNVLEAARVFGVRRVVYTSAFASLGAKIMESHKDPITDDAVFRPDSMYGATKILNEVMASIYADRFGVDSIGFRIARTFGRSNLSIPFTRFNRSIALGDPVAMNDPDYINSYIYVDDCAAAHAFACDAPAQTRRVFNLREGEYSNRELAEVIRRIKPDAEIRWDPTVNDGVPTPRIVAQAVRDELGWQPKHTLESALREIYAYWREREGLPPL
jgi:UDP-glucose 4-epimerase